MPKKKGNLGGARPGAGRPKIPKSKRLIVQVWTMMTPPDAKKVKKQAKAAGMKQRDWVRRKLLS